MGFFFSAQVFTMVLQAFCSTRLGVLAAVVGAGLLLCLVFMRGADQSPLFDGALALALVARAGHECMKPRRRS